ncbi:MAG: ATP-binding protein [Candidatus Enteromonas sp.]|nr:ATP-binding protein [Candidatus Enteromonas sp.]
MKFNRDKYLNQLIEAKGNGFPKVITGIRRCGKSYLLDTIYREYLENSGVNPKNIVYIDLEDALNYKYWDPLYLYEYVLDILKDREGVVYVMIDEIQHVYKIKNPNLTNGDHIKTKDDDKDAISFVNVILGLSKKKNLDVYVSGSNSKMLSSDIATELRNKETEIKVEPLSFKEFLDATKLEPEAALNEYMFHGGMPLSLYEKNDASKEEYLLGLIKKTYIKDIIERKGFRNEEAVREVLNLLSSCIGQLINSSNIAYYFESIKKQKIDNRTVQDYIDSFIDCFLIKKAERYDIRGKAKIGAQYKYYFSDLGLRNALLNFLHSDNGSSLENVIYNELIYRGFNVDIGIIETSEPNKNGNYVRKQREVDFIATRGSEKYYIQSAFSLNSQEVYFREKESISKISDFNKKIIVVRDPITIRRDEKGIETIGAVEFLLNESHLG